MIVLTPTWGIVTNIQQTPQETIITIYLSPTTNHTIYSPVFGKLGSIQAFNGDIYRRAENATSPLNPIFQAFVHKIGRVKFNYDTLNCPISFWIEVGHPRYITDRVLITHNLWNKFNTKQDINKGEVMGEILLGSLAEVHIQCPAEKVQVMVKKNELLQGGHSILAQIAPSG